MFTDSNNRTWHIIERDDDSIVVYYTRPYVPVHFVVYDSLDHRQDDIDYEQQKDKEIKGAIEAA